MARCGHYWLLTALVVMVHPLLTLTAKPTKCKKIDNCSCRLDNDGGVVQFRELGSRDGSPLFKDQDGKDGYLYSYNPCYPFDEDQCSKSAICQRDKVNRSTESIAGMNDVIFGYDGRNVQVTYVADHPVLILAIVSYVCVENLTPPRFTAFGFVNASNQYQFQVESQCACANVCYHPAEDEGLSAGSVLLIIFFVLVGLYLILGTIHGRVVRNAKGIEMIPHYQFWAGLPGAAKDGCLFAVRCACCRPPPKTYDEV